LTVDLRYFVYKGQNAQVYTDLPDMKKRKKTVPIITNLDII